jgi:predicted dehydrogenase
MNMDKARIAIVGVGWWGTVGHLEPLANDDKTAVVAVYSRTLAKAQERAQRFGVPRAYDDYQAMIDECRPDGVVIATTPNVHYEQAHYALEHGVHVLMEKPFVLNADQATNLQRLAHDKGLMLSVCYPHTFHPWMVQGREFVRDGSLGQILLVTRVFAQRVIDLYRGDVPHMFGPGRGESQPVPNASSYADPQIVGGGEGHTQATHTIGEMLWVLELKPVEVYAQMNRLDLELDVVDSIMVRFEGGAQATISANGLTPQRMYVAYFQVMGDKGVWNMDSLCMSSHVWLEGEKPRALEESGRMDLRAMMPRNFARAILGEEKLWIKTDVAVDTVKILDAAYRSAASGQAVSIT